VKVIEFSRAIRGELPLAVLMCDVDYFKFYNDTYGHAQGDFCLQQVADCITGLFARAGEFPARLGGEEFAVILPGASADQVLAAAERLRCAVEALYIPHLGSLLTDHVTISIGAAFLDPTRDKDFDSLLHAADQALYRAKLVRNSVCLEC
jgi:diguanylate cyclase (GGDEF)-like protein